MDRLTAANNEILAEVADLRDSLQAAVELLRKGQRALGEDNDASETPSATQTGAATPTDGVPMDTT